MTRLISFGVSVTKALGYGNSRSSVISSVILCILSFFYIFTLGSFIKSNIFVLQNGITYDTFFDVFVINKSIDHILIAVCLVSWLSLSLVGRLRPIILVAFGGLVTIGVILGSNFSTIILNDVALLSIPVVIIISTYNKFVSKKILIGHSDLLPRYLAILSIAIGVITAIVSITRLFSIHESSIALRDYAYDIFVLFSSVSPIFMVLLIFCIPLKLLAKGIMAKLSIYREMPGSNFLSGVVTRRCKSICISLIMLLSVMLVIVPHLPVVNNNHQLVGSDTSGYIDWQNKLAQSKNVEDLLHKAFVTILAGDRPVSLILIFGLVKTLQLDASTVIDNLPIILSPVLVLVVYFFTRELSSSDRVSLLAALFTAVSFQTLVGAYAGYYANWIALIIGYLGFVFLFRFLKKPVKMNLILFSGLMVLLLYSHEYTWTVLTIVMSIFLIVMVGTKHYKRRNALILLLIIVSTVIIDIAKTTLTGVSNGFGRDLSVAHQQQAGINQFANRWNNLKNTMQNYYGAQFSNFIILGLALYWVLRCNVREIPSILFMIFFSIGILPLFFGDWIIQSRVFYDIPFQIPAALGLSYVRKHDNGVMILLPICIWLIAVAFKNVSNFTFPS
jgi:hypothetical protein